MSRNLLLPGFFGCFVALMVISGCTARKHILTDHASVKWSQTEQQVRTGFFASLPDRQLRFETLNARGKGLLTINNKDQHEVNIQIRMEAGKSIWVSVTALLGMEVGRVLITPDSVLVINRMDSEYWAMEFSRIHHFVSEGLDFESLQQLLAGNVSNGYYTESVRDELYQSEAGDFWLKRDRGLSSSDLYLHDSQRMQTWKVRDTGPRIFEVNHIYQTGFFTVAFPRKTSMSIKSGALVLLTTIDYSRLSLDQPVTIPFSIPGGYRHVY